VKIMVLSLCSLFSLSALANDGGIVGVKVEDMKFEKVEIIADQAVRSPIELPDTDAIQITFRGGDVAELMKWLPGGRYVAKDYSKHVRDIAIAAKEGYLIISCADADLDMDERGKEKWTMKEPSCSITFNKYSKPVDDEWITDLFGDWQDLQVPNACKMK